MSLAAVDRIGVAVTSLAIARGTALDDAQSEVYLRELADVDPAQIERACSALAKEPRREYAPALPAVGDIREKCREFQRADADLERARVSLLPAPKADEDGPRFYCQECLDESSGFRIFACGGAKVRVVDERTARRLAELPSRHCGRLNEHAPHSFAERCHCWQHNPVVARRSAAAARKSA